MLYAFAEVPCKVEENAWAKVLPILCFLELSGHTVLQTLESHYVSALRMIYHPNDECDGYNIK